MRPTLYFTQTVTLVSCLITTTLFSQSPAKKWERPIGKNTDSVRYYDPRLHTGNGGNSSNKIKDNDNNLEVHRRAIELTENLDNCAPPDTDGDGTGDACDLCPNDPSLIYLNIFYRDADGDRFGDPFYSTTVCSSEPPPGYVIESTDCDDSKLLYADNDYDGFGAGEPAPCGVPDNTDCNDADSTVHSPITYYRDADGDGFGRANDSIYTCSAPQGFVKSNTDCNDADSTVHAPVLYYRDADGDGFGDLNNTVAECSSIPPSGYVSNNTDCDDINSSVNPGTSEICGNGVDDNCDGLIDGGCTSPITISIADASVIEGSRGFKFMIFRAMLSAPVNDKVIVNFKTQNGTAKAGLDFLSASGTLTFEKGITQKNVKAIIVADKRPESNETFTVQLLNPINIVIARENAVGTILDDDTSNPVTTTQTIKETDNTIKNYSLWVFPNPAKNVLTVRLSGFTVGEVILQLRDAQGRVFRRIKMPPVLKLGQQKINVSGLAKGVYFLEAADNYGVRQTKKVVIAQ